MPRAGLGHALDLISLMQPAGALCDFSTYFNGTSEVTEPFVIKAPLYLNGDRVANTTDSWEGSGLGTWSIFIRDIYLENLGSTGNRLFEIEDTTGSDRIDLAQIGSTLRLGLKVAGGTTVNISGIGISTNIFTTIEARFSGADATKLCEVFMDGVSQGSTTINISGGWSFDRFAVGGSSTSANEYTGLYSGFEIEPLDSWNFVSNQSDGTLIIGANGIIVTVQEAITGSTQYPGTGFVWPVTTLFRQPKTGPLVLGNDKINSTITRRTGLASGFDFSKIVRANSNTTINTFYFEYTDGIDSSKIDGFIGTDTFTVRIYDLNGVLQFQSTSPTFIEDQIQLIEVDWNGSALTVSLDGVAGSSSTTGTLAAGLNIDKITEGGRLASTGGVVMDLYKTGGTTFPALNVVTRLWTQTDPLASTFKNSENDTCTLVEGSPTGTGAVFPNIGVHSTAYLISDTKCTQPSGNQELVVVGGVGVTDKGLFVFNLVI